MTLEVKCFFPPMKKRPDKKNFAWGNEATRFFYELQPSQILDAVEVFGLRCNGRVLALNSMENRVYEVGIEAPDDSVRHASVVAKFYRPGRWTKEQILDEHAFLLDLQEEEIPVVSPMKTASGETLFPVPGLDIWCAVFPKQGGRLADELDDEQLERVGRLLARLHIVGRRRPASSRMVLNADTYGLQSLQFLQETRAIPADMAQSYATYVKEICSRSAEAFQEASVQRIHGDAHHGNLLYAADGPCWLDFDDMAMGPPVQDIWLLTAGRDEDADRQREALLAGYEAMIPFDRSTLRLIEPLRALRYIHFSAWIAKRWEDPAFPRAFPQFGTTAYWREQLADLRECLSLI